MAWMNLQKKPWEKLLFEPFGFLVRDNSDILIAGCTGVLMYNPKRGYW